MNTETVKPDPELSTSKTLPKGLGQLGVSALALVSLLIAAILNPDLWVQFGISVSIVLLTMLFVARVEKVTRRPGESTEAQILIEVAESQVSRKERVIKQIARFWPALALLAAGISVVLSTGAEFNLSSTLATFASVLLLTDVRSLALTIPVAISNALRAGTSTGILIRNRKAFEIAARLDLLLFTKGGLLTEHPRGVNAVHLAANSTIRDENKLLSLAASVESLSGHAFSKAITKSANNANLKITKPKAFNTYPGFGVQGNIAGRQVLVGSTALLIQRNIRMEVQDLIYADENTKNGYSIVCVVVDGVLEGLLRFSDVVKPSSAQAVYLVAKERIRVGIATGDSAGTAKNKAEQLVIAEVYAELSPTRKAFFVESEQASGARVGAIADPVTDYELLRRVDLSIALGEDLELATVDADVLVRSDDPSLAAQVISLSARLRRRVNLGLGFGLGYGVLSLVAFVAIVSPLQVETSPAIAALLGSLSVLFVTLNAYSLGKLK
jgi:P-type E1-E2 ATPase